MNFFTNRLCKESSPTDVRNTVVPGQSRVEDGEVRIDKIRDIQVCLQNMMDELNRFLFEKILGLLLETEILRIH